MVYTVYSKPTFQETSSAQITLTRLTALGRVVFTSNRPIRRLLSSCDSLLFRGTTLEGLGVTPTRRGSSVVLNEGGGGEGDTRCV